MFEIFNFPNLILLPIKVWLVGILVTFLVAIPFWFIWSHLEVGKDYFSFLPQPLQSPRFWPVVGIFICLSILSGIVLG